MADLDLISVILEDICMQACSYVCYSLPKVMKGDLFN